MTSSRIHTESSTSSSGANRRGRSGKGDVEQSFRRRPDDQVKTHEGHTILLACEVDNQQGPAQWLKDGDYIYHSTFGKVGDASDRQVVIGDPTKGDYSLELRNLQPDDSGHYECQVHPVRDDAKHKALRAWSDVIVQPQPVSSTTATTRSTINSTAPTDNPNSNALGPFAELAIPLTNTVSNKAHPQARDILSLTKLPQQQQQHSSNNIQTNYPPSAFITAHASTSSAASQLTTSNNHLVTTLVGWPYMLLGLAALLLLANIYLIVSLIKRHQREREDTNLARRSPTQKRPHVGNNEVPTISYVV